MQAPDDAAERILALMEESRSGGALEFSRKRNHGVGIVVYNAALNALNTLGCAERISGSHRLPRTRCTLYCVGTLDASWIPGCMHQYFVCRLIPSSLTTAGYDYTEHTTKWQYKDIGHLVSQLN